MNDDWSCSICLEDTPCSERLELEIETYNQLSKLKDDQAKKLIQHLISITQHSLLSCTFQLPCQHKFHMRCILRVYQPKCGTIKCPNCRYRDSIRSSKTFSIFKDLNTLMLATRIIASRFRACELKVEKLFQYSALARNPDVMAYHVSRDRLAKSFQNILQLIQSISKNLRKYNEQTQCLQFYLDVHLDRVNDEMNLMNLFKPIF